MVYKFIQDKYELKRFYDFILPDLLPNEVYFVSLSARNKYLTTEERYDLSLGRTEMFERRIIKKKNGIDFIEILKNMKQHLDLILPEMDHIFLRNVWWYILI